MIATVILTQDQIDEIINNELKDYFNILQYEIARIKKLNTEFPDYEKENLKSSRKYQKAVKRVLKYCMTHNEFIQWESSL